jgi:hypothetical protein
MILARRPHPGQLRRLTLVPDPELAVRAHIPEVRAMKR